MNDNKIQGLAEPSEDSEAANMKYVDNKIHTQINSLFSKKSNLYDFYDLEQNFIFLPRGIAYPFNTGHGGTQQHNHGIWYRVTPRRRVGQTFVAYFSAHHNNLKPGNYTALFEVFSISRGVIINDVSTMAFDNTAANSNYKFIQLKSQTVDNCKKI